MKCIKETPERYHILTKIRDTIQVVDGIISNTPTNYITIHVNIITDTPEMYQSSHDLYQSIP